MSQRGICPFYDESIFVTALGARGISRIDRADGQGGRCVQQNRQKTENDFRVKSASRPSMNVLGVLARFVLLGAGQRHWHQGTVAPGLQWAMPI